VTSQYRLILPWAIATVLCGLPLHGRAADAAAPETPDTRRSDATREELQEIIVSARKRTETQIDVPISITAFSAESLERLNVRSFDDYATKTPNLSFSYGTAELGYGATRSVAIRGISGEGTVGVYIDDTPVPDSIDPRVVDIERIEVLKGPQGTLFGQGSLGGNLRIITTQPAASNANAYFQSRVGGTSGGTGPDFGLSFAASQNLIGDLLTARLVGFVDHTAGFLTRAYPGPNGTMVSVPNQGADHTYGGSAALLWKAAEPLSVTLRIMFQQTEDYGWAAPYAPLPGFDVTSLTLNRAVNIQEGTGDHWYLPSVTLNYRGNGFTITSSTSYFDRDVLDTEDATEGTDWYFANIYGLAFPATLPIPWDESIPQRRTTNETRVTFEPVHGLSGIFGIYVSRQYSNENDNGHYLPGIAASGLTSFPGYCPGTPPCPTYGSDLNWYSTYPLHRQDDAVFGELYYDWRRMQLTLGLRGYRDTQSFTSLAEGAGQGYVVHDNGSATQSGATPKAAVSYKFDALSMLYASAAKGFREGGVSQPPIAQCGLLADLGLTPGIPAKYRSDTVWNYEVGAKSAIADGRMIVTGALFQMNWNDIQQAITLPVCFLGITVNEGAARARGGEVELSGKATPSLELRAGLGYDDAKITGQGLPGLPPAGSRVAQIPRLTANVSGTFTHPLTDRLQGFFTADFSYVGDSTSNTAALGYPLTRGSYTLLNGSFGIQWGKSELSVYAANITNQHPNLGDLNPAGYVRHESLAADAPIVPRVATLQPFNAGLQYRQRF
jgi:iron complex outermembrane recepter protein